MSSDPTAMVRKWLADPLPKDVSLAIERLARTEDARYVAIMPDVHLSHSVCIGTVLATSRFVYPEAVGGDIGCGVTAVSFNACCDVLESQSQADRLLSLLRDLVPINRHHRSRPEAVAGEASAQNTDALSSLSGPHLESIAARDGSVQFGTLGRGNHFLEFQADEENRLWLLVHSGSRAMGQAIRDWHLRRAIRSSSGLHFLDAESDQGRSYLSDVKWAMRYASRSRRAMADAAARAVGQLTGATADWPTVIETDHNHVLRESHFGQEWWVHRKGAASAKGDEPGVIPGSMATDTYHVIGRGCAESLCSSSHGAGRAMSRQEARHAVSQRDLMRQLRDVRFDQKLAENLREEAPDAYKDIRKVMRAQRELVKTVRRLRPILCYKGS